MKVYRFSRDGQYYSSKSADRVYGDFIVNPTKVAEMMDSTYWDEVQEYELPDNAPFMPKTKFSDFRIVDIVIFKYPDFGTKKQRDDARKYLIPDQEYTIKTILVNGKNGHWGHNMLELQERPGKLFRPTMFLKK